MAEEFNLDDVNLDDINLDDVDLSDFGEVNDSVDEPHIKVSSKAFKEFLKVSKKICSSGGKDIISKSTCIRYDFDRNKVVCYATDFDVYVESELDCINTENVLRDSIVIPTDVLIKLTTAVPASTTFYKKDDKMFIRLFGGDMELENSVVSMEKFVFADSVSHDSTIDVESLKNVLRDFSPVVSAAINPGEKRIACEEDGTYANYMFAALKDSSLTGKFDLKPKDIDVIRGLLGTSEDTQIEILRTGDDAKVKRVQIKGSTFAYSFLVSDMQFPSSLKDNMSSVVSSNGVFVDFVQIYKMVELASELPYAVGKVALNYTPGGVVLKILTKKGGSNDFDISGSIEGDATPMEKDLVVQAKLLRIILRTFASKPNVKLSLSDKGLGLSADDYSGVIYSEA